MGSLETIITMSWEEANSILLAGGNEKYIHIDGYRVNLTSDRYKVFRKNRSCICCGKVGNIMKLQFHTGSEFKSAHFNLYDEEGLLFTKDHIIPSSRGGKNILSNLQTMCTECNGLKADMLPKEFSALVNSKEK